MVILQKKKKAMILTSWDLKSFFDTENLIDCMTELYKKKVKGKIYRLLYKMNENIRISVNTPVGMTEERDTNSGVGQGTVEGSVTSASSIDGGVTEVFDDKDNKSEEVEEDDDSSDYKLSIEDLLHPMIFMDDVLKGNNDVESAQDANNKMVRIVESKLLTLNLKKSNYTVVGEKKAREKLLKDLQTNPLKLDGTDRKYVESTKYLGNQLSINASESVAETVKKRTGLATNIIYEIRAVVDDKKSDSIGALSTAFLLFESALVPMILAGADSWLCISKKTMKELDKIHLRFLRVVLACGTGTPIPQLYAQTGSMLMSNRVLILKLMFCFHVANLAPNTLARQVFDMEGREEDVEGLLTKECKPFLES